MTVPPSKLTTRVTGVVILGISLLLAVLTVLVTMRTLQDARSRNDFLFNGDPLWPASLYEDVMVDGFPYSSFMLPGANSFFPDVGLYFAIRTLTGSVNKTMALWMLAFSTFLTLGAASAISVSAPPKHRTSAFALAICCSSFLVALCNWGFFWSNLSILQAFLPVHHGGAVACAFFGLALTLVYLTSEGSKLWRSVLLASISMMCAAIVASDRLFLIWFTGPIILTLFLTHSMRINLLALGASNQRNRFLAVTGSIGVGSLLGHLLASFLHQSNGDVLNHFFSGAVWSGLPYRCYHLFKSLWQHCVVGDCAEISMVLWFPVSVVVLWKAFQRSRKLPAIGSNVDFCERSLQLFPVANPRFVLYCCFTCLMLLGNGVIFLLSSASMGVLGIHPWPTFSRYFMGPELFSIYGWCLLLVHRAFPFELSKTRLVERVQIGSMPAFTAMLIGSILLSGRSPSRVAFNDYPLTVERIDAACKRLGLEYGLGDYAQTRSVTLLSKERVKIRPYAFDPAFPMQIKAFHHTTSAAWFWQPPRSSSKPVKYEFIVIHNDPEIKDSPSIEHLTQLLGEPSEKIDVGSNYLMLVYNRPTDVLHAAFTHELNFLNCQFRYGEKNHVTYPGGSMMSLEKITSIEESRTVMEGRDKPGVMAFGPYLIPPSDGQYQVVFRTSSKGTEVSNGRVYVLLHMQGGPHLVLGEQETRCGANQEVTMVFDVAVGSALGHMEFQTLFTGKGELTLHEVELSRDRVRKN